MRCPACGATNPDEARWCGQCYQSFAAEKPSSASAEPATPPAPGDASTVPAATPATSGFRRVDDQVEWECVSCATYNDIDHLVCTVCGTPLAARYERPEPPPPPEAWTKAMAFSAVVPGAGHVAIGRIGAGIARALLFAVWLIGAVMITAGGGGGAMAVATPLYLGAFVLWAGSLIDLTLLRQDSRELLGGRSLLWLVVGVLILTGAGMFVAAAPSGAAG